MKIIESILTNNPCYTTGKKIQVKGLMLHSVGCPQPKASVFVKSWNKTSFGSACVHAFIDAITGDVHQTLPWDHRAWHSGGYANNTHIGVEMCEPDCIKYTGGSTFKCSDLTKAKEMVQRTYYASVELFAFLCKQYNLDPMKKGVIISHKEGCDMGWASNHGDPEHLWKQVGLGYTMDGFRKAVKTAMGEGDELPIPEPENATEVKSEAVVSIAKGAVYYSGKPVPDWVISKKWIVASVKGDRAVIDKSADGKNSICSPINTKYLIPDGTIVVGSVVSILKDAVYYSGKKVPDWVQKKNWVVLSIKGDRVVIDKSADGKHSICSPIHVKYLVLKA